MQPRRDAVINAITTTKAKGPTAGQVARSLGMTLGAVMNHIKHIRKTHAVQATAHDHDARVKHYRIAPPAGTAPAAPQPAPAVARATPAPSPVAPTKPEAKPTLSATELEDAIIDTLRLFASPRQPMNMDTLRERLDAPATLVRPAVIALVQREAVTRIKGGYHLPKPALADALWQPVATPRQVDVMTGRYDGAEMRPFTGRAGAMDAFRLPSRGMRV